MTEDATATGQCRAWSTIQCDDLKEFLARLEALYQSDGFFIASAGPLEIYTTNHRDTD